MAFWRMRLRLRRIKIGPAERVHALRPVVSRSGASGALAPPDVKTGPERHGRMRDRQVNFRLPERLYCKAEGLAWEARRNGRPQASVSSLARIAFEAWLASQPDRFLYDAGKTQPCDGAA